MSKHLNFQFCTTLTHLKNKCHMTQNEITTDWVRHVVLRIISLSALLKDMLLNKWTDQSNLHRTCSTCHWQHHSKCTSLTALSAQYSKAYSLPATSTPAKLFDIMLSDIWSCWTMRLPWHTSERSVFKSVEYQFDQPHAHFRVTTDPYSQLSKHA